MDPQDEQEKLAALPLPVVPRLDRLEVLIQLLEEKQRLSKKQDSESEKVEDVEHDGGYKPVLTAFEEVHSKGTLMDRIALLENRVLQLSLQLDVGSTSRSTTSLSTQIPERNVAKESDDHMDGPKESFRLQGKLDEQPEAIQNAVAEPRSVKMQGCGYRRWRRKAASNKNRKKLFEWLQL